MPFQGLGKTASTTVGRHEPPARGSEATRVSPTLVGWHARTTSMRWSANGNATGMKRARTRSTMTIPGRSSTRSACTRTRRGSPPGARPELHLRGPDRPLPDHAGQRGPEPNRVRLFRSARRERRHQDRDPSSDLHRAPGSPSSRRRCAASGPSMTGAAKSTATTPPTSSGISSSSCAFGKRVWPTGPWPRSTGAPAVRPCWPMSRCFPTAPATVPAMSS